MKKTEEHSQQQARRAKPTAGKANQRAATETKDEVNKAKDFSKFEIEQGNVMDTVRA